MKWPIVIIIIIFYNFFVTQLLDGGCWQESERQQFFLDLLDY